MALRPLPSLNALRAFEAAGRLHSLSAAATDLCVTPGAVSRHIALLEEHFGCQLFLRERRGVQLTAKGRIFYKSVHDAFVGIDEASRKLFDAPSTHLSVFCYTTLATEWLVPRLHLFHRAHPEIEISLKVGLTAPNLTRGEIDVAIVAHPASSQELAAEPLFPALYAPVCAPGLLLEGKDPALMLAMQPLIHAPREKAMWQALGKIADVELDFGRGLKLETLGLTYQAARGGAGVALGQLFILIDDLEDGRLAMPTSHVLDSQFRHSLVFPASRQNEPAIEKLRAWMRPEVAMRNKRVEDYLAARGIKPIS